MAPEKRISILIAGAILAPVVTGMLLGEASVGQLFAMLAGAVPAFLLFQHRVLRRWLSVIQASRGTTETALSQLRGKGVGLAGVCQELTSDADRNVATISSVCVAMEKAEHLSKSNEVGASEANDCASDTREATRKACGSLGQMQGSLGQVRRSGSSSPPVPRWRSSSRRSTRSPSRPTF